MEEASPVIPENPNSILRKRVFWISVMCATYGAYGYIIILLTIINS